MADAPMIAADQAGLDVRIRKRFAGGFALEAAFHAAPGFTILFGPSGSGKTTLLECIAGLQTPDSGLVAVDGRVIFDSERRINVPVRERTIGYLFQNLALFPHLTVEGNVAYGVASQARRVRDKAQAGVPVLPPSRVRVQTILESFRVAHLAARKPGAISGGERQRVALARSLITDPALLLLDEPLSALDAIVKSKIIEDLRAWNASRNIPIIYVTHSPAEAFALGERIVVLESGEILAQGSPQEVLAAPRHETIAQLAGFENIFDATVTAILEDHGTMRCRLGSSALELEVPLLWIEPGSKTRVAIRAGDILVATARPEGISARNTFQGKLLQLDRRGVTVIAIVDAGERFEVHLTPSAIQSLRLEPGQQVWLIVKTYSCHLVAVD